MNRRWIKFLWIAAVLLTMCSCNKAETVPKEEQQAFSDDGSEDKRPEKVLKLAMTKNEDSDMVKAANKLSSLVFEETDGRVLIEIYPDSSLGDQTQFLRGMELGTVEMCLVSMGTLEDFDPYFSMLGPVFVIEDEEHATAIYESETGKKILKKLEEKTGLISLAEVYEGYRNIWSKEPIEDISDLKGLKIRVPESDLLFQTFSRLGAQPVPLAWNEVYPSLQAGAIDAVENDMESIVNNRIYNAAPYCTETRHLFSDCNFMITQKAMDALNEEEQEILRRSSKEAGDYAKQLYKEHQEANIEFLKEQGVVFRRLGAEERKRAEAIIDRTNREYIAERGIEENIEVFKSLRKSQ